MAELLGKCYFSLETTAFRHLAWVTAARRVERVWSQKLLIKQKAELSSSKRVKSNLAHSAYFTPHATVTEDQDFVLRAPCSAAAITAISEETCRKVLPRSDQICRSILHSESGVSTEFGLIAEDDAMELLAWSLGFLEANGRPSRSQLGM